MASDNGVEDLRARFKDDGRIAFLGKPYTSEQLRSVLASLNVVGKIDTPSLGRHARSPPTIRTFIARPNGGTAYDGPSDIKSALSGVPI
jgi:hypothetical protein